FPQHFPAFAMGDDAGRALTAALHAGWVDDWGLAQAGVEPGGALGGWKATPARASEHGAGSGRNARSRTLARFVGDGRGGTRQGFGYAKVDAVQFAQGKHSLGAGGFGAGGGVGLRARIPQ